MGARDLYALMVRYLTENNWRREEKGSGWWWKPEAESDAQLGEAVLWQLEEDGIDSRESIDDEPEAYWPVETPDA